MGAFKWHPDEAEQRLGVNAVPAARDGGDEHDEWQSISEWSGKAGARAVDKLSGGQKDKRSDSKIMSEEDKRRDGATVREKRGGRPLLNAIESGERSHERRANCRTACERVG